MMRWQWHQLDYMQIICTTFQTYKHINTSPPTFYCIFTVQHYASTAYAMVSVSVQCPSVCHKPVLYQNNWTNRAGFWHGGFLSPIPRCVIRKFGHLQKFGYFPPETSPQTPALENFTTASQST